MFDKRSFLLKYSRLQAVPGLILVWIFLSGIYMLSSSWSGCLFFNWCFCPPQSKNTYKGLRSPVWCPAQGVFLHPSQWMLGWIPAPPTAPTLPPSPCRRVLRKMKPVLPPWFQALLFRVSRQLHPSGWCGCLFLESRKMQNLLDRLQRMLQRASKQPFHLSFGSRDFIERSHFGAF